MVPFAVPAHPAVLLLIVADGIMRGCTCGVKERH